MRTTNRLGCLTGTGIVTALLTALIIAGYAYARGGLMYNPGPLSTQGDPRGGGQEGAWDQCVGERSPESQPVS